MNDSIGTVGRIQLYGNLNSVYSLCIVDESKHMKNLCFCLSPEIKDKQVPQILPCNTIRNRII
jgi:hypothetical protein